MVQRFTREPPPRLVAIALFFFVLLGWVVMAREILSSAQAEQPAPLAGPACVDACTRAFDLCSGLATWMLEEFPGPLGEKYYVLQTWACFESTAECVAGC